MKLSPSQTFFLRLQDKIEKAELENRPIQRYVLQQIKILQETHDQFISSAKLKGLDLNHPLIGRIEIRQYSAMKDLAKKINLPVEEYDKLIQNIQKRITGNK